MSSYVKGDAVANATSYELFEKIAGAGDLDAIAYENLSYRDIFVTNNLAPDINNNSYATANKSLTYADSAGTTAIREDASAADNYVPPYSLYVSGASSQQAKGVVSFGATVQVFLAANVKITDYTKGYCGMILGSNFIACASKVTDGWEVCAGVGTSNQTTNADLFVGSASSANLTGYVNNPVAIRMDIFTTPPSEAELIALYKAYNALLVSGKGYVHLDTASEINFEVSALGLATGDHVLVVKAKADGYADSDYSNEVTYTAT